MEGEKTPETPEHASTPATPDPAPGRSDITRKSVLRAAVFAAPAAVLLGSGVPALARERVGEKRTLDPTPTCDDGDDPTPPQMEGPYFKPNSPERSDISEGGGTPMTLTGLVYGVNCQPLADVLLDFWQADPQGNYDNVGYRFRGHQFTSADGGFQLTTVVPGLYPGRTRHLHVKVQAPGQPILTTQLYFPGEPGNGSDPIYDARLLMDVTNNGGSVDAAFDFVLNVG
ncbi:dioxygenase [Streptomyces sp. AJS327]|uniref:dioxygenase family protein n=1 Tax=Streptomyces sp. AJS327 TaxID=2545265 RepID=UPI0015DE571A|nr:dioxygenase [Streptomyces sp. AJS327]MBA0053215.1 dioxygenase [Streptomyces sp. AJS327]